MLGMQKNQAAAEPNLACSRLSDLPFYFSLRAFSIQQARLSRSLEQAKPNWEGGRISFLRYMRTSISVHVRKSGFQNPRNFCVWNSESVNFLLFGSGILGFGIRNTAQGIRNLTNYWNAESKFH